MATIELVLHIGKCERVERYDSEEIESVELAEEGSDGSLLVRFTEDGGPAEKQIVRGYRSVETDQIEGR